jgi:hypothetical protein
MGAAQQLLFVDEVKIRMLWTYMKTKIRHFVLSVE